MINFEQKIRNTNTPIRVFLILIFVLNLATSMLIHQYLSRLSGLLMLTDILILSVYTIHLIQVSQMLKIGFKAGLKLILSYYQLERELIDARIFKQRNSRMSETNEIYASVPKYQFKFKNQQLILLIENSIKFNEQLEKLDVSSALIGYVVSSKYKTPDLKWMVFELENSNFEKIEYKNLTDFKNGMPKGLYINVDNKTKLKFGHYLISGKTGSGKSYAIYNLLIQLMLKRVKPVIIDPKQADLTAIAHIAGLECGNNADEAIEIITKFRNQMNERKTELNQHLVNNLAKDYSDFRLMPKYLIIDELAALQMMLSKEQKAQFNAILTEIILMGRQLGFFIIVGMQQASATLINTNVREQFNATFVLGSSGAQTYTVAFGMGVDVPARKVEIGSGWVKTDTNEAVKFVSFPLLSFDLNETFDRLGKLH
jgi:hypothetical protein